MKHALLICCLSLSTSFLTSAFSETYAADLTNETGGRHQAGEAKTGQYSSEGFFAGGENIFTAARLTDIRRAKSSEGYERIVFELVSSSEDPNGVPYFHVQPVPDEGRLVVSIWGDIDYDFDGAKIGKDFAKSELIKRLNVVPRVEDGVAIIEITMAPSKTSKKPRFEVFRLANKARIVVDVI